MLAPAAYNGRRREEAATVSVTGFLERMLCPECGRPGFGLDVEGASWMACDPCGVRWRLRGPFSGARQEAAPGLWAANRGRLRAYREVAHAPGAGEGAAPADDRSV